MLRRCGVIRVNATTIDSPIRFVLLTPPSLRGVRTFFVDNPKRQRHCAEVVVKVWRDDMEEEKDYWPIIRNTTIAVLVVMIGAIVVDLFGYLPD